MILFQKPLQYVLAASAVVCLACHASWGANANLGLVAENDNTWELWAWTSSGDNDGIMAYDVEIIGTRLTGTHQSPLELAGGIFLRGFIVDREPIPNDNTGSRLFAGMRDDVPGIVYYGVGSPDAGTRIALHFCDPAFDCRQMDWDNNEGFRTTGVTPFDVPDKSVLLAAGTGDWRTIGFGGVTEIEVWSFGVATVNGLTHEPATVSLYVDRPVPEPTAAALMFVLLLVAWCAGRRG